ncbi:MAG: 3-phosphoshikimate 1-carboxyvinyltransferase [Ignavibacteriales bacterium]|nr:3-phosphoshikimate 1-carboxyvinyltransferase [Ignavibacteriales bacterium]
MIKKFNKIEKVKGTLFLPGDKSISHRAVMFSCLANSKSVIHNCLLSADVQSTMKCFRTLGCEINIKGKTIEIIGKGFKGFAKPQIELDAGNSGTTTRLITGILAAQNFQSTIIGDESLSKRPMLRVSEPLTKMGAKITTAENGTLPMTIYPVEMLQPIEYELNIPSAQIKSAILLAGLHIDEITTVIEPVATRNHTETMLNLITAEVGYGKKIFVSKKNYPVCNEYFVPSDISTAAFFIVLTLFLKNSELRIKNILLNETRAGIIVVLKRMGARISIENERLSSGEKVGDIIVRSSDLQNIEIEKEIIPNIIDEIPILSVAGLFADGKFEIRNVKELRVKETDRISAVCNNMKKLGINVEEFEDGFSLDGEIKHLNNQFESYGDHRIAMTFSVLSLLLDGQNKVNGFGCVDVSNPEFLNQLSSII